MVEPKSQIYSAPLRDTEPKVIGSHCAGGVAQGCVPKLCHDEDSKNILLPENPRTPLGPLDPVGPTTTIPVPSAPREPVMFNATLAVATVVTGIAAKLLMNDPDNALLALTACATVVNEILCG